MVKPKIEHPLHSGIGSVLRHIMKKYAAKKCGSSGKVTLARECDGDHNLPLFTAPDDKKSNATELCNVDAIIMIDQKIKIILEIEESGFLPTKICGKYLTSNLAKYYQYKNGSPIALDSSIVTFIQVLDTQNQSEDKQKQFKHIETAIKNLINVAEDNKFEHGCIKDYNIVLINAKDIKTLKSIDEKIDDNEYNKKEYNKLKNIIENELGI